MPHKKKILPILPGILQKIAPGIGAEILVEPEWGFVGQIRFKGGRKSYFRYSSLDINTLGACAISSDKDYSNFFMAKTGYPIVPGSKAFFSDEWAKAIGARGRRIADAYRHAAKIGFPVVAKPNSGSQGRGVAFAHGKREFYRAMKEIFKIDRVALVQSPVAGRDYRLVVLDDRVISAYERVPLSVMGDGRASIAKLLAEKQKAFVASGRDTRIRRDDPRIAEKLARQDLSMRSVPAASERIFLLDNANLSTGGDSLDVTGEVHPEFRKIAVSLTRDMGLRLCGVDLIVAGDIREAPGKYWVLEINSAPGLDHYAQSGKAQEKIVEDLYLEVLRGIERSCG